MNLGTSSAVLLVLPRITEHCTLARTKWVGINSNMFLRPQNTVFQNHSCHQDHHFLTSDTKSQTATSHRVKCNAIAGDQV